MSFATSIVHFSFALLIWTRTQQSSVKILTDSSFEAFLSENELVFLKVFAPWCQICQSAVKPFQELSEMFAESRMTFAEINGEDNPKIVERFKLQGFPSMMAFVNGTANHLQYLGAVDEVAGMKAFVEELLLKRDMPEYAPERVEQLKSGENFVGFGVYCGERNSEEYLRIVYSSMLIPNLVLFFTDSKEICSKFSVVKHQLAFQRLSGASVFLKVSADESVLQRQLRFIKFDAVNPFLLDYFSDAIEGKFPMLIYIDPKTNAANLKVLEEIYRKRLIYNMLIMHNKLESDFEREYFPLFGVAEDTLPKLIILVFTGKFVKYRYEGDFSLESLENFVRDFYAKKLTPHLVSEEEAKSETGALKQITSTTMYPFVLDPNRLKVLLFYSPSCPNCEEVKELTAKLAEEFVEEKAIVFGVIDITKNEVPNINEAPMLSFFSREPEKEPTFYKGPLDYSKIKAFVIENMKSQPISTDL